MPITEIYVFRIADGCRRTLVADGWSRVQIDITSSFNVIGVVRVCTISDAAICEWTRPRQSPLNASYSADSLYNKVLTELHLSGHTFVGTFLARAVSPDIITMPSSRTRHADHGHMFVHSSGDKMYIGDRAHKGIRIPQRVRAPRIDR